jgi:predicted phage baseplate assembly protein
VDEATLAIGSGRPSQVVGLPRGPVVGESLQVTTVETGTPQAWLPRLDFDASTPADRHVVLDPLDSTLTFGDGQHGRVVPPGAQIQASYLATLGDTGNVPAGSPVQLAAEVTLAAPLGVLTCALPATGGLAAESFDHAAGRAVANLQNPTRAVSADDYETLVRQTPGAVIARTHALPGVSAQLPGLAAPGVVTVIVLPAASTSRPTPSQGLLRAVHCYLERRRILGTHIDVVGPTFVEVKVVARIRARSGAAIATVTAAVQAALQQLFDPLAGGADRGGWPFGRPVYRAEVLQVIDAVAGVDTVLTLEMSADGQPAQCGNLCLGATQLVASGQHQLEVISA